VWAYDTGGLPIGKTFGERFGEATGPDPLPHPPVAVETTPGCSVGWPRRRSSGDRPVWRSAARRGRHSWSA
jgi:hypothetical protein